MQIDLNGGVNRAAKIGSGADLLAHVFDNTAGKGIEGLALTLWQRESGKDGLLLLPAFKARFGEHAEDVGDGGQGIDLAGVTQSDGTHAVAIGPDHFVIRGAVWQIPVRGRFAMNEDHGIGFG